MSNAEEPKAGQWWLRDDGKVMLIAFDERTIGSESSCPIIAYRKPDCGEWYAVNRFVRRLPDDAGFDYKPEPEYPQYWTTLDTSKDPESIAYIIRTGPAAFGDHIFVEHSGRHHDMFGCAWNTGGRRRLTKEEAESLVIKPKSIPEIVFDPKTFTSDWGPFEKPSPDRWFIWSDNRYPIAFVKHADGKVQNLNVDLVFKQSDDWNQSYEDQLTNGELVEVTEFSAKEYLKRPRSASQIPKSAEPDPEEWVTQDRVPDRTGIDQWRRVDSKHGNTEWEPSVDGPSKYMHGHTTKACNSNAVFEVRCRRKDLPPLPEQPPKPNRIPVRLYWYDGNVVARYDHSPPTDPSFVEIKFDPQRHISDSGFYVELEAT